MAAEAASADNAPTDGVLDAAVRDAETDEEGWTERLEPPAFEEPQAATHTASSAAQRSAMPWRGTRASCRKPPEKLLNACARSQCRILGA